MDREFVIQVIIQAASVFLATAIPIIILAITLRHNKKAQEKNNNMQNSLLAKEGIDKAIERTRNAVTSAYNQLEEFLFITSYMKPNKNNVHLYKEKIEQIYVVFRKSINGLRFNTEIYRNRKYCEGCVLCDIRLTGDLVKATHKLQEIVVEIDREVSHAFNILVMNFEQAEDSINLVSNLSTLQELGRHHTAMLSNLEKMSKLTTNESELNKITLEFNSISNQKLENEKEISTIEQSIAEQMKVIGKRSTEAYHKINDVRIRNKPQLDSAIFEYFDIYREYAKQYSSYIMENGKPSTKCKKRDDVGKK
jgi:hypothetical protein